MEPKCGVCGVQRLLAAHNLYLEGQMMNRGGSSQKSKLIPTWQQALELISNLNQNVSPKLLKKEEEKLLNESPNLQTGP